MGNIAILNLTTISKEALEPVFNGPSALERAFNWGKSIPEYNGLILLSVEGQSNLPQFILQEAKLNISKKNWTEKILIEALSEVARWCNTHQCQAMFYAWGDCPLLDSNISQELWDLHRQYFAQYTFADGYPYGLTPEILSVDLPDKLISLANERTHNVRRDSIFEVLRTNINAFDVETTLSKKDLRLYRVSICCDTKRNKSIAEKLYKVGGVDAQSLCEVIPKQTQILRDLPAYFPIQITDHCPQACSYCPFPKYAGDPMLGKNFMEPSQFKNLCQKICDFAGDAIITPSLWGEPASHPHIYEMIRSVLDLELSLKILIETSAIGWKQVELETLAQKYGQGQLQWIVSMDSQDPHIYEQLRGKGFDEAKETALLLNRLFGNNCWIQAVRMNENEENLESFYKYWKEKDANVIIQKHDSYAGYLENRQPADLSPINRFPCWHLKRDMPIQIDGTVPVCRTDLGRRKSLGNAFNEDLESIWNSAHDIYLSHINKEYPGPCAHCDEYYTFNF